MEKAKDEINEKKRQIRMLEQRIKSAVTSQPIANAFEMSQVIWWRYYLQCKVGSSIVGWIHDFAAPI